MKTNATILTGAKAKFTKPVFEIEQETIPFGSYYEVYGQVYLPIPKPVFPVGATLEFGTWWDVGSSTMTPEVGVPFKIEVDDPDYDPVASGTSLEIYVSGDKLWREEIAAMKYERGLISDPLGHAYRCDTDSYLKILHECSEPSLLELVQYKHLERFWRCRFKKTVGPTTYYSAMSDVVSFNVKFTRAEAVDLEQGYPGSEHVSHEKGLWFDGVFYYVAGGGGV